MRCRWPRPCPRRLIDGRLQFKTSGKATSTLQIGGSEPNHAGGTGEPKGETNVNYKSPQVLFSTFLRYLLIEVVKNRSSEIMSPLLYILLGTQYLSKQE